MKSISSGSSSDVLFLPRGPRQRLCELPLWASSSPTDDDDDDGEDSDDDNEAKSPPRIRAKFDRLFSGMPSMQDILRGALDQDDDNDDPLLAPATSDQKKKKMKRDVDDSWFQTEKQLIQANYDQILGGMLKQLEKERREDPDAIPENAEALIKSVLKQEMQREIAQMRDQRIEEMLGSYEKEKRMVSDELTDSELPPPNEEIQQLIDESEAEFARQEANRLEIEDFLLYEQEAVLKSQLAGDDENSDSGVSLPGPNENLDQWALERLKEMAGGREDSDGDEMVLDILQDNVQELEDRIRKEAGRTGSIQPETMKEWQMYRAIATRLTSGSDEEASREAEILMQLESWKDYIQKEEGIRKKSGLARGPRLPFAWQESDLLEREIPPPGSSDKQSRIDTRKQLNRMSIEAMESLLSTTDLARRERLQKEIDFLKATLEDKDYLDVEESFLDDTTSKTPVDLSDLFQTSSKDNETEDSERPPATFVASYDTSAQSKGTTETYSFTSDDDTAAVPPKTPFFEEEWEEAPPKTVPPPNTEFFADVDEESDLGETLTGDSKLGTMEDQKLEAMYRRAGARTTEERAAIRKQWEEFQAFEKSRRDESGLSGQSDDESAPVSKDLKYNVSDVMREDGDIDAEAILATIGPRPSRGKKSDTKPSTDPKDGDVSDPSLLSAVGKKEVMNSLYRAVEAVGGGRYRDDPDAKAQQQESFEQYMLKEKTLRDSLDDPNLGSDVAVPVDEDATMDDVEYAEEVLSSLGSRPKPKRSRIIDPGDYSDKGGVLSSDDYDDTFDESENVKDDDEQPGMTESSDEGDLMPEWLRKENEEAAKKQSGSIKRRGSFLGSEIDEVFDDTDYEHNMRQLAEYEKRRAGRERQMGIDISDVLGRSAFDTDDYADYKYEDTRGRQGGDWSAASFASRKANLLDYIELDVMELNNLMDHKSSVYSTGVSQYLPRINKPFSEFGAVFRLEGVLVSVDGLQLKAWKKVAEQYGYKAPMLEEVQRASVTRPEVAVKEIFFWTDDFLECRNVASSHRHALKEVFRAWTDENGITVPDIAEADNPKESLAIGDEVALSSPQLSHPRPKKEYEKLELVSNAWAATAEAFGKGAPRREEIVVAASLSPDIAVTQAFGWTADPSEVDSIVYMYRSYLRAGSGRNDETMGTQEQPPMVSTATTTTDTASKRPLTQTEVMEMHYQSWKSVAESFGYAPPTAEEVLAAFVINEPEVAIEGFGWSDDPDVLRNVAGTFSRRLEELKRGRGILNGVLESTATKTEATNTASPDTSSGPSPDDIFQVSFDAWKATARNAGLREPDAEQVQFALTVGPEEAILTGFRWTSYPDEVARLVESYKAELAHRRPSWLKTDSSSSSRTQPSASASNSGEVGSSGLSADEIYLAAFNAWTDTAKKLGFPMPDDDQVQFAMSVGAEEAVVTGFCWTDDRAEAVEIVEAYKAELNKRRSEWIRRGAVSENSSKSKDSFDDVPMFQVNPGAAKWVKSLLDVEMQCGVISYLERDQVNVLLQEAGLDDLITPGKRVSASNGYPADKDQVLGAALRLERRPDHCVLFDSTPYASIAAHDVGMQSVSLIGPFPRYELLSADTTSSSFGDLTAMNIRRLFSERVYDQPMVESAQSKPETRAITKTRFFYDDD